MKKANIHKILYVVSALLVLGFFIRFGIDAYKYDTYFTSAPLYVYALGSFVQFVIPGIIVLIVAIVVQKKFASKEEKEK